MQQETMQNVHQMQASLQHLVSQSTHPLNGASSSSSTPPLVPPTTSIPGYIKLAKPSLFTGAAKANVETWLFEVEQYLLAYGVNNESQRIAFASASLKGLALQWWQNHCILHPGLGLSWAEFKEEVRKRFQPVEASRTARVNLRSLKQGNRSVTEYCSAFYEQLQLIHDMSEADKVENFMMGLSSTIYAEVDRRDPLTLQDAMTFAQRTEIRSRVRNIQRGSAGYDNYKSTRYYNQPSRNNGHDKTSSGYQPSNAASTPVPMELGRIGCEEEEVDDDALEQEWMEYLNELDREEKLDQPNDEDEEETKGGSEEQEETPHLQAMSTRRRQLPKEEFIRLRKEGKCFRCKQTGHWSRECPNPSRPQPPRTNGARQPNPSKY